MHPVSLYVGNVRYGRPTPKVVLGADPAAGAEVSVTVPGGVVWIVESIRFPFVASGVAASRHIVLRVTDGTVVLQMIPVPQADAVLLGESWDFTYRGPAYINNPGSGKRLVPWEPPTLLAGSVIETVTSNLQAGDNYGAPALYVVEYSPA